MFTQVATPNRSDGCTSVRQKGGTDECRERSDRVVGSTSLSWYDQRQAKSLRIFYENIFSSDFFEREDAYGEENF